jgi:hypothetical protein
MALWLMAADSSRWQAACAGAGQCAPWLPPTEGGVEINPWIVIGEDDRVLIRVNQSKSGRACSPRTDDDLRRARVRLVEGAVDVRRSQSPCPREQRYRRLYTAASSSVRLGRELYQQAGASARER